MSSTSISPVKVIIFAKRKEGTTKEQFSEYWRGPHAELFLALPVVKKRCIKYEQFHEGIDDRATVENALSYPQSGWDGVAFVTFDSSEGTAEVFNDPAFKELASTDSPKFLASPDVSQYMLVVGNPEVRYSAEGTQ
ncbi:hypothetical protein N7478_002675 [Penicillium angulare]|uniref:uncharacterized protein n=1 Tax=Penicillium angulare TaxID=116970 RepID=UPI00253F6D1F|nr:uncharacterized protein N7478_002675 [Penicillium angulare]KAJ5286989.1 hypothetical protein N7478_002675 [Penicillium angulare]